MSGSPVRVAAYMLLIAASPIHSQPSSSKSVAVLPPARLTSYTKDPAAKKKVQTSVDDFVLWVDDTKWRQNATEPEGGLTFANVTKGGFLVKAIVEDTGAPLSRLRELALTNFKKKGEKVKVVSEEKRIVNGRPVLALQVVATVSGLPVKYFGYYYGGSSGSIQLIGMMLGAAITNDNLEELTKFLNGLEVSDEDLPATGILYSGLVSVTRSISVKYDSEKWESDESHDGDDDVKFTFKPSSGDDDDKIGVAALGDRTEVPIDALPKFVLSNFRETDPKAKIVSKKRCRVNGTTVWFLKITMTSDDEAGTVYCYCYSGKAGTVQVYGIVATSLLHKYEKDLMEFLNGLLISE